jgi:hypothetical protein
MFETVLTRKGKRVPVPPDLAGTLAPLAAQCGLSGREAEVARGVVALVEKRQQGALQHNAAVAAYLTGLGIEQVQLGRLLLRCPYLFSWPVEQRAGVLFGQLMALGLTAAQAARCVEQQPFAAETPSFEPAIAVLAPLLAAGCRASDVGKPGEQLLGELLVRQPAAVRLLQFREDLLQQRLENLLQLGLTERQLVACLQQSLSLLSYPSKRLAAREALLQQELGADRQLWLKLLHSAPKGATVAEDTLRQRAQALVAVRACSERLGSLLFQLTLYLSICCRSLAGKKRCGWSALHLGCWLSAPLCGGVLWRCGACAAWQTPGQWPSIALRLSIRTGCARPSRPTCWHCSATCPGSHQPPR